jgi:Uma2 family endonuclease
MAEPAIKRMTFAEFTALNGEGRYELVDGRLEELVAPSPFHSWTGTRLASELDSFLLKREPEAFWGVELDIPTIPFFGRRPDFAYFSTADAVRVDLDEDRVLGVPTLVVEVLSRNDEDRDLVEKREEYARAGIANYWILDPQRQVVLILTLRKGTYDPTAELTVGDTLTSNLFPGLKIPVRRLFRTARSSSRSDP